jgi:hypothetical protein
LLAKGFVQSASPAPSFETSSDSWQPTSIDGVPPGRYGHTIIWTGNEMIVWGGYYYFEHFLNSGAKYNPTIDTWTPITSTNAPVGRLRHTAVWTGNQMIVWGGESGGLGATTNTGGRYDPVTDTWTPMTVTNAPAPREWHSAVWTGSELIVWGGCSTISCNQRFNDGGRYDPVSDTWRPITSSIAARYTHQAFWTGDKMIVWGGTTDPQGYSFDPDTNIWTPITTTNAPAPAFGSAGIWTGSELIVWGGCTVYASPCPSYVQGGGRYQPDTDTWTPITTTNAPATRNAHTAVWTGSEMIVWGGSGTGCLNTGGRYNPNADTWISTSIMDAPSLRCFHGAAWTGATMIIWGGCDTAVCGNAAYPVAGGKYKPSLYHVYLPIIFKPAPTPTPQADLRIVTLSSSSAPEYVTIQNYGEAAQNMTDWHLVSVVGPQTFDFPAGYILAAGATVRIESNDGATNNPPAVLFWSSEAIWNNAGDKAELRDSWGNLVSSTCYGSGCP